MKQWMEDQSPVIEKPTRRDTVLPGLRENNVIYTFTDTASVITLICRHKGSLQTGGLLKLGDLKPNTKSLRLEQKVLLPLCKIQPHAQCY